LGNGTVRTDAAAIGQVQDGAINWVAAGGTADAITATYSPAHTALTDGLECKFRASAANATTTPTFSPDGLTAHTITKKGGTALVAGDIPAALAEIILRYNLANTRWELVNPSQVVVPAAVNSIADATNGGLNFSAATGAVTANLKPSDLLTKSAPIAADSFLIMDSAASSAAKTSTLAQLIGAFMAPVTGSLGVNASIGTGAYVNGPTINPGSSGTWFVSGQVTILVNGGASGDNFDVKLWDGSSVVVDSAAVNIQPNVYAVVHLSGKVSSFSGNLAISVIASTVSTGLIIANATGSGKDSTLTAFRIG
jgi:hypothetical protein